MQWWSPWDDGVSFQRREKSHGSRVCKMREDSGVSGLCGWKACGLVQCQYKVWMHELWRLVIYHAEGKGNAGGFQWKGEVCLLLSDCSWDETERNRKTSAGICLSGCSGERIWLCGSLSLERNCGWANVFHGICGYVSEFRI